MSQIYILCIDDEPDVLDVVVRDLAKLEDVFPVESAESADEARSIIDSILSKGDKIGLILCDHVMPGQNGVELLVSLEQDDRMKSSRKVLLTGQAGLDATIIAVNQASLSHYIAKPWSAGELVDVSKKQLAEFVIEEGIDPKPYMQFLDPVVMSEAIRRGLMGDL